jgi:predicted hotdog family 3-hydroxylacyl-ACP dehydratase
MTLPSPAQVLPHRPPMILIDELLSSSDDSLCARVRLREDSPFVEDGRVSSLVAIEYMAQTVAALAGLRKRARGEEVRRGYLLGCRELKLPVAELRAGDELTVRVRETWATDELGHFDCSVTRGEELVALGVLSVYQGELPAEAA